MRGCSGRGNAIVLLLAGIFFIIGGISIGIVGARMAREAAERAERLPVMTARDIDRGSVGTEMIVEGFIDPRNPTRFRNFVAYIREEYRGLDANDNPDWKEDERWTPPLLIATEDGAVQVANDAYRLEEPPVKWQESDNPSWNSFSGEGTKRYAGFESGSPAMVIGRIVDGVEGRAIEAELMFGGTHAGYIAFQRTTASISPIIGLVLGGIGLLILLGGIWFLFRG
jgi:hypothetical protein